MNVYILNRDSAGDDASQSFSMNYHTLAANEDDKDLNNSNQNDPLEHKSRGNLQNGKENVKPRNPLRRSLSARHRAIKVRISWELFVLQYARTFHLQPQYYNITKI